MNAVKWLKLKTFHDPNERNINLMAAFVFKDIPNSSFADNDKGIILICPRVTLGKSVPNLIYVRNCQILERLVANRSNSDNLL